MNEKDSLLKNASISFEFFLKPELMRKDIHSFYFEQKIKVRKKNVE